VEGSILMRRRGRPPRSHATPSSTRTSASRRAQIGVDLGVTASASSSRRWDRRDRQGRDGRGLSCASPFSHASFRRRCTAVRVSTSST
jgi:hypothetical protein